MNLTEALERYERGHSHPWNRAAHMIGIPLIIFSPCFAWWDWKYFAIAFIAGWFFQFLGHAIEGNRPRFFDDPRFLVVGPLYFVLKLWKR